MAICTACSKDKYCRKIWIVAVTMFLCQECYKKLQKAGLVPRSIDWDGLTSDRKETV